MGKEIILFLLFIVISVYAQECVIDDEKCARMGAPFCKDSEAYLGEKSETVSGRKCQKWTKKSPHDHQYEDVGVHNYCRNPDGDSGPWCFTDDPDVRYEFCFPPCQECIGEVEDGACAYMGSLGCQGYSGTKSQTVPHQLHPGEDEKPLTCQKWTSQEPHTHRYSYLGDHNHCRSDDAEGPWCYTTNKEVRWKHCFSDCSQCKCTQLPVISKSDEYGEILSPRNEHNYCSNLKCKWTFKNGEAGSGIALQFREVKLGSGSSLKVNITPSDQERLTVKTLTGHIDDYSLPKLVFGSDGDLSLGFDAGWSTAPGFKVQYTRFKFEDAECVCPTRYITVTEESQTLTSPNFPQRYCNNMQCQFSLRTAASKSIEIVLEPVDLAENDTIEIFEDPISQYPHFSAFKLNASDSTGTYVSAGSHINLGFRSDGFKTAKGFMATVRQVPGQCICENVTFEAAEGTFASPGFPDTYCPRANCFYSVKVPEESVLQINFTSLKLPAGAHVQTPHSARGYNPPLMQWSTRASQTRQPFTFDTNQAEFRYKTGEYRSQMEGFDAVFTAVKRPADCSCPSENPQILEASKGTIEMDACGPLDCFYELRRPDNTNLLQYWIEKMDIRSKEEGDFVQWLNQPLSSQGGDPSVLATLSGGEVRRNQMQRLNTYSSAVVVHFHLSGAFEPTKNDSTAGFRIRYRWDVNDCEAGRIRLGQKGVPTSGNLSSPSHPQAYGPNLNCKWVLVAPAGQTIKIKVTDLNTENNYDYLRIFNSNRTTNRLAELHGTLDEDPEYSSTGRYLTIQFTSDGAVHRSGFFLTYSTEKKEIEKVEKCPRQQELFRVQKQYYRLMMYKAMREIQDREPDFSLDSLPQRLEEVEASSEKE